MGCNYSQHLNCEILHGGRLRNRVQTSDVNKKNEACLKKKTLFFLLVFFGFKKNIVFFVFYCYF